MKLLLFAGTSEGRILAEKLVHLVGIEATVCVATEYGREAGAFPAHFDVISRRLNEDEMKNLMIEGKFDLVVDATHPYALEATANIQKAAAPASVAYLRLLREEEELHVSGCHFFDTVQEAVAALRATSGNVLVATGSKELEAYTAVPDYVERLYLRVLPTVDSIEKCIRLGFLHSHIIAMQGPFSAALNRALMEQYDIRHIVTKNGGKEGGFAEKIEAAQDQGVEVLVIRRPIRENGMSFEEVLTNITDRLEKEA